MSTAVELHATAPRAAASTRVPVVLVTTLALVLPTFPPARRAEIRT